MQVDADAEPDEGAAPPVADLDFPIDDGAYPEAREPLPPGRRLAIALVLVLGIVAWSGGLLWLGLWLFA